MSDLGKVIIQNSTTESIQLFTRASHGNCTNSRFSACASLNYNLQNFLVFLDGKLLGTLDQFSCNNSVTLNCIKKEDIGKNYNTVYAIS